MPNSSEDSPEVEKPTEDTTTNYDNVMEAGSLKLNFISEFKIDVESIIPPVKQTICTDMILKITERPDYVQIINNSLLRVRCENQLNPGGGSIVKMDEKTDYPQVIDIRSPILTTHINFVHPIKVGHLDLSDGHFYMTAGEINYQNIAFYLRRDCMLSKTFSKNMAVAFPICLHKFDLTTLFILTALYESSLYFANIAGLNLVQRNMRCNGITICDMSGQSKQEAINTAIAIEAIVNGRICFSSKNLSPQDIQLLRALTVGAQALFPASDQQLTPIGCTFNSPGLAFMLYRNEPFELPSEVNLTADTVRASAQHLAVLLNCRDAYVKGYVRAQTMLNGRLVEQSSSHRNKCGENRQYFMSSLETQNIYLPRPLGHNFLWGIMNLYALEHNPYDSSLYEGEFVSLSSLSVQMSVRVGAAVATMFGLGISATFHYWNISGFCLNEHMLPEPGFYHSVRKYLDILFLENDPNKPALIYRTASAFVAQFTKSTLNSQCFQSFQWNGNAKAIVNSDKFSCWQVWGRNIPYIVRPLCINWHLERWPSLWGYSSPPIAFDLRNILVTCENPQDHRLNICKAQPSYAFSIKRNKPFEYIPFGNMLLNTLSQHIRDNFPLVVSYTVIKIIDKSCFIHREEATIQPKYRPKFFSFEVGQMPTYDWGAKRMLIPQIRRQYQRPHIWVQLLIANEDTSVSKFAGICN